ncbi:MAG: class I SAM-dependent methyltransferase [Candidatus Paceibacterota bacterium]|jgi:hypothetical protein
MKTLEERYKEACEHGSDINLHLPTLKEYADKCESVTELGVRMGLSTIAFLSSKCRKLTSYDINPCPVVHDLAVLALPHNDFLFYQLDTSKPFSMEETDMLFVDTLHTYEQVKAELASAEGKVRKYIAFHDTELFGHRDEAKPPEKGLYGAGPGILPAIKEFMEKFPAWKIVHHTHANNGLTIISRV